MGRCLPICTDLSSLRKVILRALTEKQILILKEIEQNAGLSITSLLNKISREKKIPLSTLKLGAKILKELNLISVNLHGVRLTDAGLLLLSLLDSPHSSTEHGASQMRPLRERASGCRPGNAGSKHPACQRQAPCDSPAGETG